MDDCMKELKEQRIWMLWRWGERKGKRTKIPMSVAGGPCGTDGKWSGSWALYDEAVAAREKVSGAAGVGFKIPEGYFFIDIDGRTPDDPLSRTILSRHGSYAEYSVSGSGIHQYGKCDFSRLPMYTGSDGKLKLNRQYYMKNPKNRMELYIGGLTNRFAVFTGNAIENNPLRECTDAILTTLDRDMRRKENVSVSPERDGSGADFDIVCRLRSQKNGDKFSRLYDDGDFSGYGSQSEADAALCAIIAFRTGPDPEAIDSIFRSSALYRDKWEREDYRRRTIEAGIEACHGKFHRSKMEHPYFVRFNEMTGVEYISVQLLARYVRENLRYLLVRDNGKQELLKYVYEDGCYRLYSNDMFMGCIKRFIAEYDDELVKMRQVSEAMNNIITDLDYVSQDDLNSDESLINFRNGLLKLAPEGTELLPHTPDILSTIQIPCDWKGEATPTPVFDDYMRTLTDGDAATEQLLLEFIGVCLSNVRGSRMKKALFMVGSGDTGKSQLKSLVERLLGRGNFISIDLKEIEARFGTGVIYGTRLAGSSDMSFLTVNELKTFKMLTGGDAVFAEFKGSQGFQYTYTGMLWFCMNSLPKFGGDDGRWVYDRIMVVKCPNVIPEEMKDKMLLEKMYAERDGIVFKAVTALRRVIANGYRFTEPEKVREARAEYMSGNSTVISFFNECMCPLDGGRIQQHCTTGRIFKVYQGWCRENNNGYTKTAKEFRDGLAEHLGTEYTAMTTRVHGNTYYRDYTLTLEAKEQYKQEYGYDSLDDLCG